MNYEKLNQKKALLDSCPLSDEAASAVEARLRTDLAYSSNAIEGNTLTFHETRRVIEKNEIVDGKSENDHLEAHNHARAWDWVREQSHRAPGDLSDRDILQIHGMILGGIDDTEAGRYRRSGVRVKGSPVVFPNAAGVPDLMAGLAKFMSQPSAAHPVEFAARAHYRLVTIHPFADGNGRTGRLLMNMILLMLDYPPALVQVRDKQDYMRTLKEAQMAEEQMAEARLERALESFFALMAQSVEYSLDLYLDEIRKDAESPGYDERPMKIGMLARASGESVSTIRYWTQEGLLKTAEKTGSGYGLYDPEMIERARRIRELQRRRFRLSEIKEELRTTDATAGVKG